jgi:hypothetical protein
MLLLLISGLSCAFLLGKRGPLLAAVARRASVGRRRDFCTPGGLVMLSVRSSPELLHDALALKKRVRLFAPPSRRNPQRRQSLLVKPLHQPSYAISTLVARLPRRLSVRLACSLLAFTMRWKACSSSCVTVRNGCTALMLVPSSSSAYLLSTLLANYLPTDPLGVSSVRFWGMIGYCSSLIRHLMHFWDA